jgi:signal peptidase I
MRETTSYARAVNCAPSTELAKAAELDLAAEVLASGGSIRLRALGSSMLPAIWPGDILTIESASHRPPACGDIVLMLVNHRPFIHRVQQKCGCEGYPQWITRGDAVPQGDPPVSSADMLGTVSLIQRNRHSMVPSRRRSTVARLLAWLLCHSNHFRSLCLRAHTLLDSRHEGTAKGDPLGEPS